MDNKKQSKPVSVKSILGVFTTRFGAGRQWRAQGIGLHIFLFAIQGFF